MMVFDASALLALFFGEEGGDLFAEMRDEADVPKYLHAVNAAEVACKLGQSTDMARGLEALVPLHLLGVETRRDMNATFIADVAALKADHNIALGDCFGLALTRRLYMGFDGAPSDPDASFVTADWGEMSKIKGAACSPFLSSTSKYLRRRENA
jgi:PIN domain nuclease of toxin-antitoxin system